MKIDSYDFGSIVINGKTHKSDIIVSSDKLKPNWRRKEGHSLAVEDIQDIINQKPEIIVIGMGYNGIMDVPLETKKYIESLGIKVITQKTTEAVNTYNKLLKDGRKLIGAFHLTC